jgi:hypothetical protein
MSTPKKKFRFVMEVEEIPYNKDTYHLLGDHFMEEFPEDTFAKELISCLLFDAKLSASERVVRSGNLSSKEAKEAFGEVKAYDNIKITPMKNEVDNPQD